MGPANGAAVSSDVLNYLNQGSTPTSSSAAPADTTSATSNGPPPDVLSVLNAPPPDRSTNATKERTPAEQRSDKEYGPQSTAGDIAKSALDAPVKALIGILGLPGTLGALEAHARAKHQEMTQGQPGGMVAESETPSGLSVLPSGQDIRAGVEKAAGQPLYESQGQSARFIGRAVEGASIPGARLAGAIGGVAGEAGRKLAGTGGDIVGSLAGGGLTSLAQALTGTPERVLRNALENVTDDQFRQADALVKAATEKGTKITGAEALSQVTGGNVRLQDMQRVLERTSGGAGTFEPIMQNRPGANTAAMEGELGKVAPPITQPSEIAPRVQGAAEQAINQTRQTINATAKPFYQAAESQTMEPGLFASLQGNAMFQAALKKVRGDPIYATLKDQPDNSIAVVDAVKKTLGETAESFTQNVAQAGSKTHEAAYVGAKGETEAAARAASPDYDMAQGIESSMREQFLDPLRRSATGQLAAAEKFPQQATVLFNPRPLEGSETEIGNAVKSVAEKDPEAAQQMVRAYLKQRFDELTQKLSTGPNQFGAAGFAGDVAGNAQQAKNLHAALQALPNGDQISESFTNLLQIFEAQGTRARPGSATAFNAEMQSILAQGGKVRSLLDFASPKSIATLGKETVQKFMYERNSAKLAEIFTSPDSVAKMRAIAQIEPGSAAGKALYRLLVPLVPATSEGASANQ